MNEAWCYDGMMVFIVMVLYIQGWGSYNPSSLRNQPGARYFFALLLASNAQKEDKNRKMSPCHEKVKLVNFSYTMNIIKTLHCTGVTTSPPSFLTPSNHQLRMHK